MTKKQSAPWTCGICGEGNKKNTKRKKVGHHVCYDPEIIRTLCLRCHLRLHGTGRCFNHPFERKFGKAAGPLMFARKVVELYGRDAEWLDERPSTRRRDSARRRCRGE
jgi:hypothetical protein